MKQLLTLCIPIQDDQVLLGMKKCGFGAGLWNGFGGKLEPKETVEEAARRELVEEVGIQDGLLQKFGLLEFVYNDTERYLEVHVFRLTEFTDNPLETDEMRPAWFSYAEIPYSQMWADDEYWLPLLLENKCFTGSFIFKSSATASRSGEILEHRLRVVAQLPTGI